MKRRLPKIYAILLPLMVLAHVPLANCQSDKDPSAYLSFIASKYNDLSLQFYKYMSAIAHSNNARTIERQRSELLTMSWDTYTDVRSMPVFQGNRDLRDSVASFLKINHRILKDDYDKILNMEEIAERSYDDMAAYIAAQREARNKLDVANIRMMAEQRNFAARYNITLVERTDELFLRMQEANEVLEYLNQVYLVFFKSHKDEIHLLESTATGDIAAINDDRSRLALSARSGMDRLKGMPAFNGDASLSGACMDLLGFYLNEAQEVYPLLTAYVTAQKEFELARAVYESLAQPEKSEKAVNAYNEAVRKVNDSATVYNESTKQLNSDRLELMELWRSAYNQFLGRHVPEF